MGYSKTSKTVDYTNISQFVTMKELLAMTEYIRNFNRKYASKKVALKKKMK